MRQPRPLRPILIALALSYATASQALTFVKASDEQLIDRAPLIVRAVARPAQPSASPTGASLPRTFYTLEVKAGLRGAVAGDVLTLAVPGGRDANGFEAWIPGAPAFADGEEALFFLEKSAAGHHRLVLFQQGAFRIIRVGGQRAAWRALENEGEILFEGRAGLEEKPRQLAAFESFIADRLAGRSRSADYQLTESYPGELEATVQPFRIILWNGLYVRWPKTASPLAASIYAHREPQPGIAGGGHAEVQNAIATWNSVDGGTHLRLRYGGLTDSIAGFHYNDGITAVVFGDYGDANGDRPTFDCSTQTGPLGWGTVWLAGTHSYGGREYRTVVAGDAVISDYQCWTRFSRRAFEHTVAHEIGHMLGLDHSCAPAANLPCSSPEEQQAMMYARNPGGEEATIDLSEDDRRAIRFLYGPPPAPSPLRAEMSGERRVRLFWEDRSDNETGFEVHREAGGQNTLIAELPAGSTRWDDDDTRPTILYRYRVRAKNENGFSGAAEATITTPALDTPAQLAATAAGHDRIALAWVDKAGNDTAYEVWGYLEEARLGGDQLLATLPANSQAATIDNLIADSAYTFKVRAVLPGGGHTAFSNGATAATLPAPIAPCVDGGAVSCLGAERFKAEVRWKDFQGQRGAAAVAPAGSADSGIFYFFSPDNWEMLVKVLDGCAINQHHWVFAAGTTDVETTLVVTDSRTGKTAVYFNPLGQASPAVTDTEAFGGCAAPAPAPRPAAPPPAPAAGCDGTPGKLCLLGGRFEVEVAWTDFGGVTGSGRAVAAGTADSGLFYFFSPDNWEMLVKVLGGCAINQKVWVFAAATTNVAYTLTVTDTATGAVRTYENPLGQASAAITDIEAFAACPGS